MIDDESDITELEIEIENKVKDVESKMINTKKNVSDAENKRIVLKKQISDLNCEIRKQRAKERKYKTEEKRYKDTRVKVHAGALLEMTGLLRYVCSDVVVSDNEQDELIVNLLVAVLIKAGEHLETLKVEDLEKYWHLGRDFRNKKKGVRVFPEVNKNLEAFIEKMKLKKSATIEQLNDNDNSKRQTEKIVEQPNDNKTAS